MAFRLNPSNSSNPIVFMDIKIGSESVGRMIIELRKDVVPKTAENFRALCTGERGIGTKGKPLHYKGTRFHKVQRMFMAQGGDLITDEGVGGESIFGPTFEDENFSLLHDSGAISMANYGRKNTNNSQFFITAVECPHLDGTNVVVGYVLRGFGIVNEMEKYASNEAVPLREMIIENCGELNENDEWNYYDCDETEDKLPPFPFDWIEMPIDLHIDNMLDILNHIKEAGNFFYNLKQPVEAARKYKKAHRYYLFFMAKLNYNKVERKAFEPFLMVNQLNMAAAELNLENYVAAKVACNEALQIDQLNPKALFRRGQAEISLKNYDEALNDLAKAHQLSPNSEIILNEYKRVRSYWKDYHAHQKKAYKNILKCV